jgi:hypothetical protein
LWYIGVENLGPNTCRIGLFTLARLNQNRHIERSADDGCATQITQSEGVYTHQGLANDNCEGEYRLTDSALQDSCSSMSGVSVGLTDSSNSVEPSVPSGNGAPTCKQPTAYLLTSVNFSI